MKKLTLIGLLFLFTIFTIQAQNADEYSSGFTINIDDDGSKYLRIIGYGHFWWEDNEGHNPNDGVSIRRMGVLMFSQINERFKLVSHFGLSSSNANNLYPTENGGGPRLEVIDFFGEFQVIPELYIGAGKHYYNGINRMNSISALNILGIDVNRSSWSTASLSDEGVRHLGIFARGEIGRFQYRLSVNNPITNTSDGDKSTMLEPGEEKYLGRALLEKGQYAYAGYFNYQFFDKESTFLPYWAGTHLGTKKVLSVGAGFFYHPDGIAQNTGEELIGKDVSHIAADVFFDTPLGENNAAFTTYAVFEHSSMGDHYLNGRINGNGSQFYAQAGYLIPKKAEDHIFRNRFQPFVSYSHRDFKGLSEAAKDFQAGVNYYVDGQNAKLSVQYQNAIDLPKGSQHQLLVQAMFSL